MSFKPHGGTRTRYHWVLCFSGSMRVLSEKKKVTGTPMFLKIAAIPVVFIKATLFLDGLPKIQCETDNTS